MAIALTFRIVGTRQQQNQILSGLHSGIPICCVAYFVCVHYPGGLRRWRRRRTEIMKALGGKYRGGRWHLPKRVEQPEYVPCPSCLRRKTFVKVHLCTKRCPQPRRK